MATDSLSIQTLRATQIAIAYRHEDAPPTIIAITEDGRIWRLNSKHDGWFPLAPIRDDIP